MVQQTALLQPAQHFIAAHEGDDDVEVRAVHHAGNGDADRHVYEFALDLQALLNLLEQGLYRVGRYFVQSRQLIRLSFFLLILPVSYAGFYIKFRL